MIPDVVMERKMKLGKPRRLPVPPRGLRRNPVEDCDECLVRIRDVTNKRDDSKVPESAYELEIAWSPRPVVPPPLDNVFPQRSIHLQGIVMAQRTLVRILARPAGLISMARREPVRLPGKQVVVPRAEGEALEEEELGGAHHQPVRALVGEEGVDVAAEHLVHQSSAQERRDGRLVAAPYVLGPAWGCLVRRRGHVLLGQRAVLEVLCLLEVGLLVLFRARLGE